MQVTFYIAETPLIPKKFGWFIKKGGLYFETVQRLVTRMTETGTACTMRQYRTEARNQDERDRYSLYYETVQRLVTRMTETGTA